MGARERRKGAVGEREVVHACEARGLKAKRTAPLQAAQGHDASDVALNIGGVHLEVKRRERTRVLEWARTTEAAAQAWEIPAVAFRPSREPWRVVLPLDDFLDLLKEARG